MPPWASVHTYGIIHLPAGSAGSLSSDRGAVVGARWDRQPERSDEGDLGPVAAKTEGLFNSVFS